MIKLTDANFDATVSSNDTVFIDFYANWCGPCRMVAPIVEELAAEYEGKITFCKLDTDENPLTSQKFAIESIPTLVLIKGGKVIATTRGYQPKDSLKKLIDNAL